MSIPDELRLIDARFYDAKTATLFLGYTEFNLTDSQRAVQLPLDNLRPFLREVAMSTRLGSSINRLRKSGPVILLSLTDSS